MHNRYMIWKNALKYPVLIIGIIMFGLFLSDKKTKIWWDKVNNRYVPSTCSALLARLETKLPNDWRLQCENKDKMLIEAGFSKTYPDLNKTRAVMYLQIANMLNEVAHYANHETLQRLENLTIYLNGKKVKIIASTDGQAIIKIKEIKGEKALLQHLKLTVKTREVIPKE